MQLTHSPSDSYPLYARVLSIPSATSDPADLSPYSAPRALASKQASKQPRVTPTLSSNPVAPRRARCLRTADLSTKLSILSGATFTTPTPLPFFPLFADRYIACRLVRRYHTLGAHISPTPLPAFPLRETTTGPTSWFFTGAEGNGWPYILLSFF